MGQFLAVGLVTEIRINKSKADKADLTLDQLQERMQHDLHYAPQIYTATEKDGYYRFLLNEDILHSELLPFLKTFYPLLYSNPAYYEDVLKKLADMPPSEWLKWAESEPEEAFQFDEYGTRDYLSVNHTDIPVSYDAAILSMEGKIVMETFGRQFTFVKYTMMQTFRQFPRLSHKKSIDSSGYYGELLGINFNST
ncbi:MAG: hypothetical protein D3904_04080, partial [Candidatus Electrothrix sp. EH2]|nr:hypothetical protein [Candidatus Electrothrix sp. EH2]